MVSLATSGTARRAVTGVRRCPVRWARWGARAGRRVHLNMGPSLSEVRRPDAPRSWRTSKPRRSSAHRPGVLGAAVDAAADARLRPDRFAGRPGRLDRREVLAWTDHGASSTTRCRGRRSSTRSRSTGSPRLPRHRRACTGRATATSGTRHRADRAVDLSARPRRPSRREAELRFTDLRWFGRLLSRWPTSPR